MSKKIILLRHAEKTADGDSLDLSEAGRTRAEKLASYIPKTFGKPGFLFAAAPSDSSVRCYLTLRPLADRLQLNIEGTYEEREFAALSGKLLADLQYATVDEILATGLHAYLTQFLDRVNELGWRISQDFLVPAQ